VGRQCGGLGCGGSKCLLGGVGKCRWVLRLTGLELLAGKDGPWMRSRYGQQGPQEQVQGVY
jgi:hypothetical protein